MINKIIALLFRRRKPSIEKEGEEALLNFTLELAQEWGDDWMQPVNERLKKAFPRFTQQELDKYNAAAQEAMKYGHELVCSLAKEQGNNVDKSAWKKMYLARYPWVDNRNLKHLFSTGRYYAWKNGVAQ